MKIRKVRVSDADKLADIYNHYITNTYITFEEEIVSTKEMENRIASISKDFPYLVAEGDNCILGYAYATSWKMRTAYRFSA